MWNIFAKNPTTFQNLALAGKTHLKLPFELMIANNGYVGIGNCEEFIELRGLVT